jgi:glycosyltransferase involved in cell wall biosynthesis
MLFLPRYGTLGSSSRMRFYQFKSKFESAGIECVVSPFFDDDMLQKKYMKGAYQILDLFKVYLNRIRVLLALEKFDLIWIEKEALPWLPVWFESWLLSKNEYIMDFDDAVFHRYGMHSSNIVRFIYGRRIEKLMKCARFVTAGNCYLAKWSVDAGSSFVSVYPTVVDLNRYIPKFDYSQVTKPVIVWIGSPSTVKYLIELSVPLAELNQRYPFTLRVIGGGDINMEGVVVENIDWSDETEATAISVCDIGVMPLHDTPWELGKCSYKLIQYMAAGLPTVSTPVGANIDVVVDGETGFFADSNSDWVEKLEFLLRDAKLRMRFGQAGRIRVEEFYSLQVIAPKLINCYFESVANGNSRKYS